MIAVGAGYPSPRALLDRYDLRAKKSWGQNFLGDEEVLGHIARLAAGDRGEPVVELGSGLGHLTVQLVARGARVTAVERDRDMARVLRGELGDAVTLVEADAASADYAVLASAAAAPRVAVVGNLPYHLTSPILVGLLDQAEHVERAVFLVQREVALRLAAAPGTKDWGLLSVLLQHRAQVSIERRVPAGAFFPPPRVESAVVLAVFREPSARPLDDRRFRRLVKAGFAQRRKVLANALTAAQLAPEEVLAAGLATAAIDPRRRGETLSVAEWIALERALGAASGAPGSAAP